MLKEIQPRTRIIIIITFILLAAGLSIGGVFYFRNRSTAIDTSVDQPGNIIRLETAASVPFAQVNTIGADSFARLQFRLSQGQAQPDEPVILPLATGTPLSDSEIQQILDRLPPLTAETDDAQPFNLPDELVPAPRPGQTIVETFPPPDTLPPPTTADGPLAVLRYAPEGEIPIAPFLNITFNQPMVPLTSLEALEAGDVPVKLTPPIPGVWEWVSPQILRFTYQSDEIDRFPMATTYTVEIPAGTRSLNGSVLEEAVTWTFSTPPPQLVSRYPTTGPQPLNALIFAAFDQLIDPVAILSVAEVTADNQSIPVRLATTVEIEANEQVRRLVENARSGQWLVFRSPQALPADASITVTFPPGTPSAEGPRVTETAQTFSFFTYAPLRVEDHYCGWANGECPPLRPFVINFNNPIDLDAYNESMLQIVPELPGATANFIGNTLTIRGATKGQTTYRVTIDASIRDIFGQTLGQNTTLSFRVDSAAPALSGPGENLVTIDPSTEKPAFTVYSINYSRLHVQAYAVEPSDWPDYLTYQRDFYRQDSSPTPPGELVLDETIEIDSAEDVLTETAVDLSQALDGDTGHLVVVIAPPSGLFTNRNEQRNQTIQAWVQVTKIGLDAFVDHEQMVVWASDLRDGTPLAGTTITLQPANVEATTGPDGTARFDLPSSGGGNLVARQGTDVAILPYSPHFWDENGWQARPTENRLRWVVFDDRQMYRPGEAVHIKGWIRQIRGGQHGDVSLNQHVTNLTYEIVGPFGNELDKGTVSINALGGFDLNFTLPDPANLGMASLILHAAGGDLASNHVHTFQIQEFRRPEFEVTARNETTGPYFVNDQATVAVSANYFAGGPLPNADVIWTVTSSPSHYAPPNWPGFVFGTWTPWWYETTFFYEEEGVVAVEPGFPGGQNQVVESFNGVTDAGGEHYLQIDFEAIEGYQPFSVMAEARVMDVNRQAWAAATSLLVHPADLYVGLRSERTFVQQGTPLDIEAIVTDVDGNPVPGRSVHMEAARLEWKTIQGRWREEAVEVQDCTVTTTAEPVTCTFETTEGGTYRITATVTDEQGRQNQSELTRWVSGGRRPPARNVTQETATLIPDKESYQPGDVAEILVLAPFSPAEGLLTVSRSGILYTERFQMESDSYTLRVPIEEAHIPNLSVQVDVVGAAPRTNDAGETLPDVPPRPAFATGRLNLDVPPRTRELSLAVTPQETALEPGAETVIDVTVTDAGGEPVAGAEIALVVVDEAVLALTNYQLADPLAIFYSSRSPGVSSTYGRNSIILANPELLTDQVTTEGEAVEVTRVAQLVEAPAEEAVEEEAMLDMELMPTQTPGALAGADDGTAPQTPINVRTNFNPLATFAPAVHTDAQGQAQVAVTLPDNLTRYRVMAVAVAGEKQFGSAETNLTARLPLMVRPAAPRFLNFGDQFELPVVLQNQTDEPLEVDVAMQTTNLALTGDAGLRVTVPANDRVEVRFPATTVSAGTVRLQIAAVSGPHADAATVELPVYTPATTEAFATYGVIDDGVIAQPFLLPDGVITQFGGLEITTSSTALQSLTDAVLYLTNYPYHSANQLASRTLAIAALRDVLSAFEAEGLPAPAALEQTVQQDIERLQGLQNFDGGFPSWERGRESLPFTSIHVAHALQQASLKGFDVPEEMLAGLRAYLRDIENYYPSWYSQRARQSLSAYALYVRYLMGDTDSNKAHALFQGAGLDNLSLEAVAWLWPVLAQDPAAAADVEAIRRHILNRAVETAASANFTTSYGEEAYLLLHSNRRTDGIILNALIANDPQNDLIPKVVNGLLANRTRGRWYNTQENVFILLALDRYFNTFEAETPDFVARIWLGETYAGDHDFIGRSTEYHQTDIPMSYLSTTWPISGTVQDLLLSKEGSGRLYFRLGLRYAPEDLALDSLDRGFTVQRTYEAIDDPEDVFQDENGVWHIKAGARVRVRLTMVANNRRYHVALVDPLPAGLEVVNPALAVSASVPQDRVSNPFFWWWGTWYEHQNMRDERVEAFATLLWDGIYEYEYVAQATTPGTFMVPPAKAEEMYAPEVFGRSSSDTVIVE